jgi:hypothetical protein
MRYANCNAYAYLAPAAVGAIYLLGWRFSARCVRRASASGPTLQADSFWFREVLRRLCALVATTSANESGS